MFLAEWDNEQKKTKNKLKSKIKWNTKKNDPLILVKLLLFCWCLFSWNCKHFVCVCVYVTNHSLGIWVLSIRILISFAYFKSSIQTPQSGVWFDTLWHFVVTNTLDYLFKINTSFLFLFLFSVCLFRDWNSLFVNQIQYGVAAFKQNDQSNQIFKYQLNTLELDCTVFSLRLSSAGAIISLKDYGVWYVILFFLHLT